MKGDSPVDYEIFRIHVHGCVHLFVYQSEDKGLVSYQRLIVTFGITDGFLVRPFVGQFPPYFSHAPLFIGLFFNPLDPVVSDSHGHTEVKSKSTGLERCRESCHTAHIFSYRNRVRINLFHEHGSERKISHGILVHPGIEIIIISDEVLAEPVVPIQHAGHSIEAEAVEVILLHPEFAVRQQEIFGLVLSVIEASGPPCRMVSLRSAVEIQVIATIEKTKSFCLIINAMRMDNIHHYRDSHSMCIIHEMLELFRSSEAR